MKGYELRENGHYWYRDEHRDWSICLAEFEAMEGEMFFNIYFMFDDQYYIAQDMEGEFIGPITPSGVTP